MDIKVKISDFPVASEIRDGDDLAIVQDGVNKKIKQAVFESKLNHKFLKRDELGQVNGVASLGGDGKVPYNQLPKFDIDTQITPIDLSTETPKESGVFKPIEVGVYDKFGGIEITEDDLIKAETVIVFLNGNFYKESKPYIAEATIEPDDFRPVSGDTAYKDLTVKVDTISDLRNYEGKDGQVITLLGYYEAGDKEPLNYKFTSTQGVDDGGSVINTESGSWMALWTRDAMPDDYGARADGVTDDFESIQKCIDNHQVVYLGKDRNISDYAQYNTSKYLTINKKIRIYGKGKEYTRIKITQPSFSGRIFIFGDNTYNFDTPSIFEIVPPNEGVNRYFTLEDLTTFGIEGNTDIIHINAPRVSYFDIKRVDSYYGANFIKVYTQSWILNISDCRSSLFNKPHLDIRNSNTVNVTNYYANSAMTSSGASRGYRFENSVVVMVNCDTDSVNFGFSAYGNSIIDLIACRTESRLFLVQSNDNSVINVYGGNYMQTMIGSQVASDGHTFSAQGSSIINVFEPKVGIYNFTETTDLSKRYLFNFTGSSKINVFGFKNTIGYLIPETYKGNNTTARGSVLNLNDKKESILIGSQSLNLIGIFENVRKINGNKKITNFIDLFKIPLPANSMVNSNFEIKGVLGNGVEGNSTSFIFKGDINSLYYGTYTTNNTASLVLKNQSYNNDVFYEILYTGGMIVCRLRKHTLEEIDVRYIGKVYVTNCNSVDNIGGAIIID